ncbi:DUF5908 family protein [Vannielia litorea]|uniref:DUF5908 family protein n=1 Tax=Vannielia litorea TaxID=1217970 RepID=UPI001BCDB6C2|nr:DUF5908 family protein [Vannielia litorea]MBS8226346.1 hypothetical protein [Vannielia litorea]
MTVEIREIVIRGHVYEDGATPGAFAGGPAPAPVPVAPDLGSPELLALIRRQVELALRARSER